MPPSTPAIARPLRLLRRATLRLVLLCVALSWSSLASAEHTSDTCAPKSGSVAVGGSVSIDITDCAPSIDYTGISDVDGPAFPVHGVARLRAEGGRWFADYTHGGNAASVDVFEFSDGTRDRGTVRVRISIGQPASPLTLRPSTLARAGAGLPYRQALETTGGVAPYRYAVTTGTLPPGLSLSADGIISGTATTPGTSNVSITVTDSALGSAATLSEAYLLQVVSTLPVAVADSATVFTRESVSIPVTANDQSFVPITAIEITRRPTYGTVRVEGLDIVYRAPFDFVTTNTLEYVAISAGGRSAPATVTVQVTANPRPTATSHYARMLAGTMVNVTLTNGAFGGPFTGAQLVSMSPANAGTTSIARAASGTGYVLTFVPDRAFTGDVLVLYTLSNAVGTSDVNGVLIVVAPRDDPSLDPDVRGLVDAQVESAKRFATSQVSNFHQRLERLHTVSGGGFDNRLGFAVDRACPEPLAGYRADPCQREGGGGRGGGLADGAEAATAGGGNRGAVGTWLGGIIRSGSHDGRSGGADIDFETDGVSAGIDYRVNEVLVVGTGFGYGKDENAIGSAGTRVDGDSRTVALYASYHPGSWFVDLLLGHQTLDYRLRRYIPATAGTVNGQRDGSQGFASVSVGTDLLREDAAITPYGRLDVAQANLGAYSETGDPVLALRFDAMEADYASANIGVRMHSLYQRSWGRLTPQVRMEFQHDLSGRADGLIRYADLAEGPAYGLPSTDFGRSRVMLGLGALLDFRSGWGWALDYRSQLGSSGQSDSGVSLSVQKQF